MLRVKAASSSSPVGLPFCASLLFLSLLCLPASAQLPVSATAQADWLADIYAVGLAQNFPDSLSSASISATRAELRAGLADVLVRPLDAKELWEVADWVFRGTAIPGEGPPPDLRLTMKARDTVNILAAYLSRPPLDERSRREILFQVGTLLDTLRRELVSQFGDVPEADSLAAGAVFAESRHMMQAALSPVSPAMKKPFSEEEVAALRQRATQFAAAARAAWDHMQEVDLAMGLPASDMKAGEAQICMAGAAAQFENAIRLASYTPPPVLSAEEEKALAEEYLARAAATMTQAREGGEP